MAVTEDTKRKYENLAEQAIEFGKKMIGTPYGNGWSPGSWPALSPLYAHITGHDGPAWYRNRPCICSGFINVVRFEINDVPSVGRRQGESFPGGTGAIGRWLAHEEGTRPYDHVASTPRGWLCFAEYLGSALARQGHVGIALGNSRLLEARVPRLSDSRFEEDVSDQMVAFGGSPFSRAIPPWVWMRV